MKKFLSISLVMLMLLALIPLAAMATDTDEPVNENVGDWSVYTIKTQYLDGYAGLMTDIPGYEYTEEGLSMIPAAWVDSAPYGTLQTTEKVNLKDGVYLRVRVDQFTYTAGDKWFGFSVWDEPAVELGKNGDGYGYGVETLIRINDGTDYVKGDDSTRAGSAKHLEWYTDVVAGQRVTAGWTDKDYTNEFTSDGCPILTLEIKWDQNANILRASINGAPAPDDYNTAMTRYFADQDFMAHIGFSLQNSQIGGTVGCTVLKFGTSAQTASVPSGEDGAEPIEYSNAAAPIKDPSTVPSGQPAIRLTGDCVRSDALGAPTSISGNVFSVQDNGYIRINSNASGAASITLDVSKDVSYDVDDFPIVLIITKNLCYCAQAGVCTLCEQINTYAKAGDIIKEQAGICTLTDTLTYAPETDSNGNSYQRYIVDWSKINGLDGRINGIRLDIMGLQYNDVIKNRFEVCEVGFFRNKNEARAYYTAFVKALDSSETDPQSSLELIKTNDGKGYTVNGIGELSGTEVVIPSSYKGKPVIRIAPHAFAGCSEITSVVIPDSITDIGASAFKECTGLTDLSIGNGVARFGNYAFDGCESIESVSAPVYLFTNIPNDSLKSVVITAGEEISADTFKFCKILEEITIPASITSIGSGAFYQCKSLERVYFDGSEDEWDDIMIDLYNTALEDATVYFDGVRPPRK